MTYSRQLHRLSTAALMVAMVAIVGINLTHLTFAASGSLTFNPASGSANVGDNLVLTMHENSGTDAAIGVDAYVVYPTSQLQFVSATTVAPFSVGPPDSPSGGVVEITRGAYAGQTGDQIVTVITFKVVATGTAAVTFNASKSSISPAVGSTNLLTTSPGGSYTLSTPPQPPQPPTPQPPTPQPPTPSTTPTSTTKAKSVNVSNVTVPNNGSVAVSTSPVSVEPTTVQTDGVKKVEYYIAGKLVDTETKPPYKYNIDTTKYSNGSYDLVSKTYYDNGSLKQSTQHLIVKNTANSKSTLASIGYSVVLLLIIGGVLAILLRKRAGLASQYAPATASSSVVTGGPTLQPAPSSPTIDIITPGSASPSAPTVNKPLGQQPPAPGTVITVNTDDKPKV